VSSDVFESTEIPEDAISPIKRRSHTATGSRPSSSLNAQGTSRDRPLLLLWILFTAHKYLGDTVVVLWHTWSRP
jgi:hypothetical protein